MTPSEVNRKYSKGRDLLCVFRNGYRYSGTWAERKRERVSECDATHCNNARALQTLFDACAVRVGGERSG
jgi:hypothetical protein